MYTVHVRCRVHAYMTKRIEAASKQALVEYLKELMAVIEGEEFNPAWEGADEFCVIDVENAHGVQVLSDKEMDALARQA